MHRRFLSFVSLFVLGLFAPVLQAAIYPLEVFTNNGSYYDSGDLDFYVKVCDGLTNQVDFTFYNNSSIGSSIASIYFDDDSLLGIATISNGLGTVFRQFAKPCNLPAGKTLNPSFVTAGGLSFDSEPAPPKNGVNLGEWVQITFDLKEGCTFEDVIEQLNTGNIRMGMHIIALPDGSSESAVNVPEPVTVALLGTGGLLTLRRSRKRTR